jgi:hypothetical protein
VLQLEGSASRVVSLEHDLLVAQGNNAELKVLRRMPLKSKDHWRDAARSVAHDVFLCVVVE